MLLKYFSTEQSGRNHRLPAGNYLRKDKLMVVRFKGITAVLVFFLGILMPLSTLAQVRSQRSSIEKHIKILNDKLKLNGGQLKNIKINIKLFLIWLM